MKQFMRADEIFLNNGNAIDEKIRTIMTETKLPPTAKLEYIGTCSRKVGTGLRNSLFHICGTDDLLVIRRNDGPADNPRRDNVVIEKGYFTKTREYSKIAGELSVKYHFPFDLCLALGTEEKNYKLLRKELSRLKEISPETFKNLYLGIDKRRMALKDVFSTELYDGLNIDHMGQQHTKRIAMYVAEKFRNA